ncbi:MAG: divalent-cation tolerance protein CutA [bacterium]
MPDKYQIIFVTVPDRTVASDLSDGLLKKKLAACVSTLPGLSSSYWWQGKIETAEELLLIIKTKTALTPDIIQFVRENHPYSVPETVCLNIAAGSESYLNWLGANTLFTTNITKDKLKGKHS